jgi:S-formylglutathione hydrolase FrmB
VNLRSKARGRDTSYFIYQPNPEAVAPTVILLHGAEDGASVWRDRLGKDLFDTADRLGLNLVMPDGDPFGWWLNSPVKAGSMLEDYVASELMEDLFGRFMLDRGRMGIMGISMGGHGALTLSLKRPGMFRAVGSLSGVTDIAVHGGRGPGDRWLKLEDVLGPYQGQGDLWRGNSAYHLLRRGPEALEGVKVAMTVGLSDKLVLAENRQFSRLMNELGIPHEYSEERGGHSWTLWRKAVPEQLAFMKDSL